jgi:heavy metal sensor kinase
VSLVTRLSAFFLGALAVVLAGFSLMLLALAWMYLHAHAEQRLAAALETLAAAVDQEPGGLEWEGDERRLSLGRDPGPEQPRWEVREPSGALVARSANLGASDLFQGAWPGPPDPDLVAHTVRFQRDGETWLLAQRVLHAPPGNPDTSDAPGSAPRRVYRTLILCPAVSLAPAQGTLRALAMALVGLSLGIWIAATVAGRRLCRRALAPVAQMAQAAHDMGAADLRQRLPDPRTGDELAELHRSFNGLLDRLQEAFERQQRFTGDASHQLRTPLTAMLGQLDLALRRERSSDEYRRAVAEAHAQAGRLRQIVDAMLFLARADLEADARELEVVDLRAWLAEQLVRWSAHARGADMGQDCTATEPVRVRVQPVLLGQLLDNLLENAVKYSAAGTPITIALHREEMAVLISVTDAGCGIATEDLPHLFNAFYRAAEARRLGIAGAGLGLAIAARIAAAFGGTIAVASESGRGSRFTVRLPAA